MPKEGAQAVSRRGLHLRRVHLFPHATRQQQLEVVEHVDILVNKYVAHGLLIVAAKVDDRGFVCVAIKDGRVFEHGPARATKNITNSAPGGSRSRRSTARCLLVAGGRAALLLAGRALTPFA